MARGQAVTRKTRIQSSPSPNRVPYRVCKRCPKVLTTRLLLQAGLCQKCIFKEWRKANRTYVPKQLNSIAITQSRPISLLNIERKCSQPWQEVRKFLTVNKYVDRVGQRGGAPADAGTCFYAMGNNSESEDRAGRFANTRSLTKVLALAMNDMSRRAEMLYSVYYFQCSYNQH